MKLDEPAERQAWSEKDLGPLHLKARLDILESLRRELVGPDLPEGSQRVDIHTRPALTYREVRQVWAEEQSGDEVLLRDPPSRRYSAGVLYRSGVSLPPTTSEPNPEQQVTEEQEPLDPESLEDNAALTADLDRIDERRGPDEGGADDADDADNGEISLSRTTDRLPSAAAVSFLADVPAGAILEVSLPGRHPRLDLPVNARYARFGYQRVVNAHREGSTSEPQAKDVRGSVAYGYVRQPVSCQWKIQTDNLLAQGNAVLTMPAVHSENLSPLALQVQVVTRLVASAPSQRLLTVTLINRTDDSVSRDEGSLFQTHLTVVFRGPDGNVLPAILPYPESRPEDPETQSNALLYRAVPAFASGHGCAADWELHSQIGSSGAPRASRVDAEFLPFTETPSITPDIEDENGQPVQVSMRAMAGIGGEGQEELLAQLQRIVHLYAAWIDRQAQRAGHLADHHKAAAQRHLDLCRVALGRMEEGVTCLRHDDRLWRAFQLANHAVLLQQIRGRYPLREVELATSKPGLKFSLSFPTFTDVPDTGRGQWRAFQIAFLLLSVASAAQPDHPDRETVDLIFFPTGGGKTEAYLGLTALTSFLRRLRNPDDDGVQVLMRYTLRLLTAQQFQRAATLMCAMEYLRRQPRIGAGLGESSFTVGIWLGGTVTPNSRKDAQAALKALRDPKGGARGAKNPFMLRRCPWCGAQMGLKLIRRPKGPEQREVLGYTEINKAVVLHCSDPICEFHLGKSRNRGLPVVVTDEELYEQPPTLLIGTVDKFAQLAWNPASRALFGLDHNGDRQVSPPGLIVQDELHLISGPLGSMTGLLEPVVEALCTMDGYKPKIVCSTATIRAYREQVRDLYGRITPAGEGNAALFPPPGLEASDSFFATYAREQDDQGERAGPLLPGRMYVGVSAAGFSSLQLAQIKTYATLLSAPTELPPHTRDPWWTLLGFFGSLRELGTSLTLLQTYVPAYLDTIRERHQQSYQEARRLYRIEELTGRLTSEEVPEAIEKLEQPYLPFGVPNPAVSGTVTLRQRAVDMCLASSIIEVGIDISRLSLMTILSQPKTTAQYIQVSGRVGREWQTRPGLVVTIYSPTRPRDRSHFERFRTYHQQLYAQVEPTSVTPFSPQALRRGLHLALMAYVRQFGALDGPDGMPGPAQNPRVIPHMLVKAFSDLMTSRIELIDPRELPTFNAILSEKLRNWETWRPEKFLDESGDRVGLLSRAGSYVQEGLRNRTWFTPNSLRNVDATCEGTISALTITDQNDQAAKAGRNP